VVRKESRAVVQRNQSVVAKACKNNPKKFWQYIKSKTTISSGIGDLIVQEGVSTKVISDDSAKAQLFAEFFASIYTIESENPFEMIPNVLSPNSMLQIEIDENVVANKLLKLKLNKSPGPDMLHPRVLHEIRNEIVTPLTLLYNQSLCVGTVPDEWRTSTVSVLHKKGKKIV